MVTARERVIADEKAAEKAYQEWKAPVDAEPQGDHYAGGLEVDQKTGQNEVAVLPELRRVINVHGNNLRA